MFDGSAAMIVAVWPGAAWMVRRSCWKMKMFSTHVPLTVMVLGPCGSMALRAALILEYAPGPPPGHTTCRFAARPMQGSSKRKSMVANRPDTKRDFDATRSMIFLLFEPFRGLKPGICLKPTDHPPAPQATRNDI